MILKDLVILKLKSYLDLFPNSFVLTIKL